MPLRARKRDYSDFVLQNFNGHLKNRTGTTGAVNHTNKLKTFQGYEKIIFIHNVHVCRPDDDGTDNRHRKTSRKSGARRSRCTKQIRHSF